MKGLGPCPGGVVGVEREELAAEGAGPPVYRGQLHQSNQDISMMTVLTRAIDIVHSFTHFVMLRGNHDVDVRRCENGISREVSNVV